MVLAVRSDTSPSYLSNILHRKLCCTFFTALRIEHVSKSMKKTIPWMELMRNKWSEHPGFFGAPLQTPKLPILK